MLLASTGTVWSADELALSGTPSLVCWLSLSSSASAAIRIRFFGDTVLVQGVVTAAVAAVVIVVVVEAGVVVDAVVVAIVVIVVVVVGVVVDVVGRVPTTVFPSSLPTATVH